MQNKGYSKEELLNATISNVSYKTDEIHKAMDKGDYKLAHKLREERNFDLNTALKMHDNIVEKKKKTTLAEKMPGAVLKDGYDENKKPGRIVR